MVHIPVIHHSKDHNIMKTTSENICSRREFFKQAAKGVLPILGLTIWGPSLISSCSKDDCDGCNNSCSDSCVTSCKNTCDASCSSGCKGSCSTGCSKTCKTTCQTTCKERCSTKSRYN